MESFCKVYINTINKSLILTRLVFITDYYRSMKEPTHWYRFTFLLYYIELP